MFIPLHDANGLEHIRRQYVTLAIIAINVILWFLTLGVSEEAAWTAAVGFGYVPALAHDTVSLGPDIAAAPEALTYVTYAFLHQDFWHLGGNMLFLWVFGDNVEDALGHIRFAIFYCACAAAAAWFHGFIAPASEAPLIGASGAIAGIVAAYLLLHPRVKIWILALGRIPLRIPAFIPLAVWIGFQLFMFLSGADEQVSWAAHVGGFVAGAVLVLFMRRRGVPLFDRATVEVVPVEAKMRAPAKPAGERERRWGRG